MMRRTKTAIATASGVLAVGVGLGLAGVASAAPTTSPTPSSSPSASSPADSQGGRHGRGHGFGHGFGAKDQANLAQQLATKLGVDRTTVQDALKAFRQDNKPTAPPTAGSTRPDPAVRQAALATSLASALGVDEAKVTTALTEIRAARQAERQTDHAAELTTTLDAAVKAGTLTQAEADAVQKAVDKGVIHAGGR